MRMQSCHGNEFTPMFRDVDSGESESNSTDCDGDVLHEEKSTEDADFVKDDEDVSGSEEEDIDGAFADAKDCWKVDAETLKGFYLHSPPGPRRFVRISAWFR